MSNAIASPRMLL